MSPRGLMMILIHQYKFILYYIYIYMLLRFKLFIIVVYMYVASRTWTLVLSPLCEYISVKCEHHLLVPGIKVFFQTKEELY